MPKKKKQRRPASRMRQAASRRPLRPDPVPADVELLTRERPATLGDKGWLAYLPPLAGEILQDSQPLSGLFRTIPADTPMWTDPEDEDDEEPDPGKQSIYEWMTGQQFPWLTEQEAAVIQDHWRKEEEADDERWQKKSRHEFAVLCEDLGITPAGETFADLYRWCLDAGLAEERDYQEERWVFPAADAKNILDVLPPDSELAAGERVRQSEAAASAAWLNSNLRYGERADQIMDLLDDAEEPVTTSIQRLARAIEASEDTARQAVAHLTSAHRPRATCTHDLLAVPAHQVFTLTAIPRPQAREDGRYELTREQQAGVACCTCAIDFRDNPGQKQVVAGLAGEDFKPGPLIACPGICAARYGSIYGSGGTVPPLEDRTLRLKELAVGQP